ncbi:MAG: hypothetical protein HC869_24985 [Rhodospirillales bacterium]|nr:hypothetical protein [Rhodospirillales bacterium]
MTLNLSLPQDPFDIRPKITVVGVGGAGGNAVNNMIRSKLEGVDFLVANTDAAVARGAFGIPTMFVGKVGAPADSYEMFFGKERLGQIDELLAKG